CFAGGPGIRAHQAVNGRQIEIKRCPASGRIIEPNMTVHKLDNLPRDGEAQAIAAFLLFNCLICLREFFKNAWLELRRNAGAEISNCNMHPVTTLLERYNDFFVAPREFDRV